MGTGRVSGIETHSASIGITRYFIDTGQLEWDARAADIFDAIRDPRPAIEIWQERVHPDDAHLLVKLYGDASADIGAECIYRVVLSDGTVRHILTRSVAIETAVNGDPTVLTGVVSLVRPHTGTSDHLGAALDSVSLGFAILDREMIIRYVNKQTELHLGVGRDQLIGQHLHDALPITRGSYIDGLHSDSLRTRGEVSIEAPAIFLPGKIVEVTANYVGDIVAVSFRDVTDRVQTSSRLLGAYRELLAKSRLDDLTGVLNRSALIERIERISAETSTPAAVLYIDIDNFKQINDTYGHLAGDHVLRITAARLADLCGSYAVLGRIGGDEFVIALFDDEPLATTNEPEQLRRRLRRATRAPIRLEDSFLSIELSVGIARNTGESTLEDMLVRADIALYEDKTDSSRRPPRPADD
ncbi:sensor domain-containing diguanylate cyclase [Rhodococcus sp. 06-462-5]|nr:sensor domain-containing diguanylate cyclase [Rhodococcus sp. 06-462-5]OZE63491.1 sensor domain-containing diguanylate cyclase [Rhodococcus sp. 02-925g]